MKRFISGVLFASIGFAIVDAVANVITQYGAYWQSVWAVRTQKLANELAELEAQNEPSCTEAIGFHVPEEEYYYEVDDTEDRKVGF